MSQTPAGLMQMLRIIRDAADAALELSMQAGLACPQCGSERRERMGDVLFCRDCGYEGPAPAETVRLQEPERETG